MNKSKIREEILRIRKKNISKNLKINFKSLFQILKRFKNTGKIIGGYYPYNYEVDAIPILKRLEKHNYQLSLPKIKKNSQMDFFRWSLKDPLDINRYGIPEPVSGVIKYPDILLLPLVVLFQVRGFGRRRAFT